ncbi:thioredoxin family protein [Microvirga sp. STS02]|uniref:thioredoxin family protein n=1 Tax=Hymenobacter negativus TaxID=2795026 RepID=UPI0018DD1037|nr:MULTISPECIES: thioredoxin family protein [Bacteria]MBH8570376.1 thioredoxin family protein [Hymenobacter negativus]MBR7210115.1 thioredoxin family protein [Microvirga sp. STS02]
MSVTFSPVLTPEQFATGISYAAYRQHITDLLAREPDAKLAKMRPYYQEGEDRMNHLTPTIAVLPELQAAAQQLKQRYIWVVITEGWCGDAAQIVPIIEAVAQASSGHLDTRYFLRDANPELIDRYLTNGGRAIPMTVVLHADSLAEVAVWGPRPVPAQTLFHDLKTREVPFAELAAQLHGWYAQDATRTTQEELLALVQKLG